MGNLVFQATLGGQVNLVGPNTASTYNLNVPTVNSTLATLAAQTFAGTQTISSGNLVFSGTSQVVSGDFSNATVASRTAFQTSTSNSTTGIYALPNGTSTAASWQATNTADPTNASKILIATNGSTDVQLVSGRNGSGTYLPLTFYTNGSEQLRLDTSGNLGLGVTPSAWGLGKAMEIGFAGNGLWGVQSSGDMRITSNTYYDGTNYKLISGGSYPSYYRQANGIHSWLTSTGTTAGNTSFTQAMTLDASGNLGVGTSSPSYRIHAYKSGANSIIFNERASGATGYWEAAAGAINFGSANSNPLVFVTGSVEAARIDSSGNLLVGTTSNATGGRLNIVGQTGNYSFGVVAPSSSGTYYYAAFLANATQTGSILSSNGTNTSYNTVSDYRLKEDIAPMTGALEKIAALKPVTYKWKSTGMQDEGFIAHELAEVCPHAVTGEKDAVDENGNPKYQGIDTSFLVATLTAAIQEQQAIIQQLQADVAALKGQA